ncbi:hypothetical protein E2C01_047162 [Portunus trituberculatus]|uniref:Uncharacterized protein n=1 Tax=Portunus trituberculatus TaxID=210409 RepID=A0A5B7G7S5_PORTR|nr:hypothetical protein [Portunus trituberculatus]
MYCPAPVLRPQSSPTRGSGQAAAAATCQRRPTTRHLKAEHELHQSLSEPVKLLLFTVTVCGCREVVHRPPLTDGSRQNEKQCRFLCVLPAPCAAWLAGA